MTAKNYKPRLTYENVENVLVIYIVMQNNDTWDYIA